MDRETRLGQLASQILDGNAIDWPAIESTVDASDSSIVQQLKVVAEIAALHRGLDETVEPQLLTWGHLRLLERVGSGTFGDVYRAWDPHLDREVALKLLRSGAAPRTAEASASLSDPVRVVNEGRLLARVRHPHVIIVYGAEPRDGAVGIWMEFIRGKTLHQIVEQGLMSAREAVAVGADLCGALAAVHAAGLLHRDVTARNVMRDDRGRIVLMDFGAGHDSAREGTAHGGRDIAGTPLYMAPELFAGHRADQRSDIYALGALLYYLVTKRFPVSGRSLTEIIAAHERGARTRLRDARPDLPAAFVRVIEKALEPDPAQRFQTVGELEQALEDPTVEPRTAATPGRRGPGVYLAAALAAAAVIAVVVTAPWSPAGRDQQGGSGGDAASVGSAANLTTQKLNPPGDVWAFSNPSDDGRYMAGMVINTGDVAFVDLQTGTYRPLGLGRGEFGDGYASLGIISPDASLIAVEWYQEDKGSLRLIRSDGSERRDLIPGPADVRAYQFSRDGGLILALVSLDRDNNAISLVATSDGAVRQLRTIGATLPDMMSLSPDGRYIAFDQPEADPSGDRDIFVLDAHTNTLTPLGPSPGEDRSPYWTPDGAGLVFLSDRNRAMSLWMVPMDQGRAAGEARLLRDDVGRVWLRGFTASGQMHYVLSAGHAEVYIADVDEKVTPPQVISPRLALSNFYPIWSRDGRYVAYTSQRDQLVARELWVHDTVLRRDERVASRSATAGRAFGWSPDGSQILARQQNMGGLLLVDRKSGAAELIDENTQRAGWGPAGILYRKGRQAILYDAARRRIARRFNYDEATYRNFEVAWDGRSVAAVRKDGRITIDEAATARRHEFDDAGVVSVGNHYLDPQGAGVAYVAFRPKSTRSLMYWNGDQPRELLRTTSPEEFMFWGWHGDGRHLLVVRWTQRQNPTDSRQVRNETLWRVPIYGGEPVSTGFTLEGLRDLSIHPDGRRIAFNAGWAQGDLWVMDNFLPK